LTFVFIFIRTFLHLWFQRRSQRKRNGFFAKCIHLCTAISWRRQRRCVDTERQLSRYTVCLPGGLPVKTTPPPNQPQNKTAPEKLKRPTVCLPTVLNSIVKRELLTQVSNTSKSASLLSTIIDDVIRDAILTCTRKPT